MPLFKRTHKVLKPHCLIKNITNENLWDKTLMKGEIVRSL